MELKKDKQYCLRQAIKKLEFIEDELPEVSSIILDLVRLLRDTDSKFNTGQLKLWQ